MHDVKRWLKQAYLWVFGDEDTAVDICTAFALVTFANSIMMLTGHDTPKLGTFAYAHLLLRLTIITVAFLLWDYEGVITDIRRYLATITNLRTLTYADLSTLIAQSKRHAFSTVCVIYTVGTVLFCAVNIVFVPDPPGGRDLYAGLVWAFLGLCLVSAIIFLTERAKISR